MNNNKNKYRNASIALGFTSPDTHPQAKENNVVKNLLLRPQKDNNENTPHTENPTQNAIHQADLLFLPEDEGYRYALVVVDLATRKTDAEPLKTKDSKTVFFFFLIISLLNV